MKLRLLLMSALLTIVIPMTAAGALGPSAPLVDVANGAFVHHYVRAGFVCGPDEVMVGIHIDHTQVVICARLNFGYKVANRITDRPHGTQVSDNPPMHGCPRDYLIQGLELTGGSESLTCVSLMNAAGQALVLTNELRDGHGATTSDIYGFNNPTMHACPRSYAMRGIHQDRNDLYCAG